MNVYFIGVAAALLVPLLTRGSYKRLILETKIHWGWLLLPVVGIQLYLDYGNLPHRYWDTWGFAFLILSYVCLLGFAARNFMLRGMSIVFIGIALNMLVITVNTGMPVKFPPQWHMTATEKDSVKHHEQRPGEKLLFLSDIIILDEPYNTVLSFGDLILAVGLCDVAFHASRDPLRRRQKARRKLQSQKYAVSPESIRPGSGG